MPIEQRIQNLKDELAKLEAEYKNIHDPYRLLSPDIDKDLPIGTPILVSNNNFQTHKKRYFAGWEGTRIRAYTDGGNPYNAVDTAQWAYAKRDYDAPSILNWLPNTGVAPKAKLVLYKLKANKNATYLNQVGHLNWDRDHPNPIAEYAIIEP